MTEEREDEAIGPEDVLVVRRGPGANCSSIGSALDILFLTAAAAGIALVTLSAALEGKAVAKKAPPKEDDAGPG